MRISDSGTAMSSSSLATGRGRRNRAVRTNIAGLGLTAILLAICGIGCSPPTPSSSKKKEWVSTANAAAVPVETTATTVPEVILPASTLAPRVVNVDMSQCDMLNIPYEQVTVLVRNADGTPKQDGNGALLPPVPARKLIPSKSKCAMCTVAGNEKPVPCHTLEEAAQQPKK